MRIREVCASYNKEYLVTRVTVLDLADINYSSIGQFCSSKHRDEVGRLAFNGKLEGKWQCLKSS